MTITWVGNGGHAEVLKEICELANIDDGVIIGFGALDPARLEERHKQILNGFYPVVRHPSAIISGTAIIRDGTQIMAGAVIQRNTEIGGGCIINTNATVEHGTRVGRGCHVAPGAVVLGDCTIGDFCFIGANAVIVQGSTVPDRTFVKAGSVWNEK